MLEIRVSGAFKKDVKRMLKRGKKKTVLESVLSLLVRQEAFLPSYRDHLLKGNWAGYRELHLEPDWLLIYRIEGDELYLAATGSHSDLFGK